MHVCMYMYIDSDDMKWYVSIYIYICVIHDVRTCIKYDRVCTYVCLIHM